MERGEKKSEQQAVLPSFIALCKLMLYSSCAEEIIPQCDKQPLQDWEILIQN